MEWSEYGCCKVQIWDSLYTEGTDSFPSFHGENRDAAFEKGGVKRLCYSHVE
jgi:hypothetical protein